MASGNDHSILLKHDGSVWFSGLNNHGQLGIGTGDESHIFVEVMAEGAKAVAGGFSHTIIIRDDGRVMATGNNRHGQLGDETFYNSEFLVTVAEGANAAQVAAGGFHSIILTDDGNVWVAGWNKYGQLGDGTTTDRNEFYKVTNLRSRDGGMVVSAGDVHSLVVSQLGMVWAAGSNMYGQLGDSTTIDRHRFEFTKPPWKNAGALLVAAGGYHSLVLLEDRDLWATGWNAYGQLGDGTSEDKSTYVKVASAVKNIAAGSRHSVILKLDGSVWTTGYNMYGQLGHGSTQNSDVFVQAIPGGVIVICAGYHHTMVLKRDDTVWAAGSNIFGQFGDGTTLSKRKFNIVLEPHNSKEYYQKLFGTNNAITTLGKRAPFNYEYTEYDYEPGYGAAYLRVEDHSGASKNGEEYRRADHCS